jgi:hypothetical protein
MALSVCGIHVEQSTPWSCVAACVCMVRRRRGETIDEQALLDAWGSGGPFALTVHADEVWDRSSPKQVDPDARASRGCCATGSDGGGG